MTATGLSLFQKSDLLLSQMVASQPSCFASPDAAWARGARILALKSRSASAEDGGQPSRLPRQVVTSGLGRPGLEELAELEEVEDSDQDSVGGRRRRGPLAFFQALSARRASQSPDRFIEF